ncbi:phosphoribosylformylglycinamidine synthase subunit PurL [candidate division WOR-3 bacterium]|uniref:Phosphoribosylformylglycinamidine synthase subunit PurL n=1 Tax=candidate division WOR-3 bacterium TaxID=2052148 RepID=A0A660SLN0_UNCW3|nr:MAG: phosphoribosylformylglycinamidine synthase subunit PurL [candidate division WOR-3 bacterium]
MVHRVEVRKRYPDKRGERIIAGMGLLGVTGIDKVEVIDVYYLYGISDVEARRIAEELLTDPVGEEYRLGKFDCDGTEIEITYNPGVEDPVTPSALRAIADLGIKIEHFKTAKRYIFSGDLDPETLNTVATRLLYNPLIEHIVTGDEEFPETTYRFKLIHIPLEGDLVAISKRYGLALNRIEMERIQEYFRKIGRPPTDIELETIAQTWSEHCVHKTFKGRIEYEGRVFENLIKETIFAVVEELKPGWCLSVFHDNSGVVEFDDEYGVCFKVETHNHPSALEPYGGAATGIGGVIRDILGTGQGAKPILSTDVFCFGEPDIGYDELPEGVLHPKRIISGVVGGVRDYGNRMGIPTASGAVFYHPSFLSNPLVFCGCLGIIPKKNIKKELKPGYRVILVGGKTGRDGIHGVTFASQELDSESQSLSSCVQIGNPIEEKKILDLIIRARDLGLIRSITDCGGGGLSSAVGEMGRELGVEVHLERVPLKYTGLTYTEIWISEAQERMVIATRPEDVDRLINLFAEEGVEAVEIGRFTGDRMLRLYYEGNKVGELEMEFLHKGIPKVVRKARWEKREELIRPEPIPLDSAFLKVLGSYNIASKEWIIRQYDHEVQARTIVKPLVGRCCDGPSDGIVIWPRLEKRSGLAVGCGLFPRYGQIDPYHMAASAIDEAIRNIVAVGADPSRIALLDNFCFGSPEREEVMGAIVRACLACYEIGLAYGTPFISGKDSLYNEYIDPVGNPRPILPTLLVSSIGLIPGGKVVTTDLKEEGNLLYLIGRSKEELGGSEYFYQLGIETGIVPKVDPEVGKKIYLCLHRAINEGLIQACHDLSEGGLGVALAEMVIGGRVGAEIDIDRIDFDGKARPDLILFSESNSRFLVEIRPEDETRINTIFSGLPHYRIGKVGNDHLSIRSGGKTILEFSIDTLVTTWKHKPVL